MKYLFFFITLVACSTVYSQDQIRLRFGISRPLKSGRDVGLHTAGGKGAGRPSAIGLEYFKPLPGRRAGYLLGAFIDAQGYSGSLNHSKFPLRPVAYFATNDYENVKLYAGYEKILTKNKRSNSNYFSFAGGVSVSVNGVIGGGKVLTWGAKEMGLTLDGDMFGAVYVGDGWWTPDYYSIISLKVANRFTPDIFAGLRWNIRNRRATPVFIVEGVFNYSLIPKAYIEFPYTLNGESKVDRIKDHGFNAQLNFVIPLKTFVKKSKE